MKKIICFVLVCVMLVGGVFSLASCKRVDDVTYIDEKGKLVVGVTVYPPMDYKEGDVWVGFDAELAQMFAESLGVDCEIVEIIWDNKVADLNTMAIDLVWNGMTASKKLGRSIDFSACYAKNAQVAVAKKDSGISKNDVAGSTIAVEKGSAGATQAEETVGAPANKINKVEKQVDALNEVASGNSQVAIVDITMARNLVGKGAYAELEVIDGATYGEELFAVGLRKGSNLKPVLDAFLQEKYDDGTIAALGEEYDVFVNEDAFN